MLTATQAAEKLGVTPGLVARWCRDGRLKAEKIADVVWLIREDDLAEFAKIPRPTGRPPKDSH